MNAMRVSKTGDNPDTDNGEYTKTEDLTWKSNNSHKQR